MKKRCIWNWYRKRKIEYLDERDKWFKYLDMVVLGIFIAIGFIGPIAILIALFLEAATKYQMPFQNAMRSAGIQFIVLLPFLMGDDLRQEVVVVHRRAALCGAR